MVRNASIEKPPRLTITLGQGQRETLQAIADRNHTTPTFLIRYAIDRFIEDIRQKQLRLDL
jgi:predicted transcriptional regulator